MLVLAEDDTVNVSRTTEDVSNEEEVLRLGDYTVCDWETLELPVVDMDGVPIQQDQILLQGVECDTGETVILSVQPFVGVQGSIGNNKVLQVIDADHSSLQEVHPHVVAEEEEEVVVVNGDTLVIRHKFSVPASDRRSLDAVQQLVEEPIVLNVHVEMERVMVDSFGGNPEHAASHAISLFALVSREVFEPLGVTIRVSSVAVRVEYRHQTYSPSDFLQEIFLQNSIPGAHFHVGMTTNVGSSTSLPEGLFRDVPRYAQFGNVDLAKAVISNIQGSFLLLDRLNVARHVAILMGAVPVTHECRTTCQQSEGGPQPSTPGTIYSDCHFCDGPNNVVMEFDSSNIELMAGNFAQYRLFNWDQQPVEENSIAVSEDTVQCFDSCISQNELVYNPLSFPCEFSCNLCWNHSDCLGLGYSSQEDCRNNLCPKSTKDQCLEECLIPVFEVLAQDCRATCQQCLSHGSCNNLESVETCEATCASEGGFTTEPTMAPTVLVTLEPTVTVTPEPTAPRRCSRRTQYETECGWNPQCAQGDRTLSGRTFSGCGWGVLVGRFKRTCETRHRWTCSGNQRCGSRRNRCT